MNRFVLCMFVAAATAASTGLVACAHADPGSQAPAPTGPPQPGASCPADLDGTLAALPAQPGNPPNRKDLLECSDDEWRAFTGEYPSSDSWLSSGPELVLRGQGMRNPEMMAGQWTGTPQEPDGVCRAESVQITGGPEKTGAPEILTAQPGQPLSLEVSTRLLTAKLSGFCLWERS